MSPTKELAVGIAKPKSASPYQLDENQTLRASRALLKHLSSQKKESSKQNLLDDDDEDHVPASTSPEDTIWLVVTGKKFISDKNILKPHRIPIPHPFTAPSSLLLLVKDPQRSVKDMIPLLPAELQELDIKVVGLSKLKKKYKSYESRRLLNTSYEKVLADDRIVPSLPTALGKVFYKSSAKVPIPIKLSESPAALGSEIQKALKSTYCQISAAATTSIRVGSRHQTPEQLAENVAAVVAKLTEKNIIPQGWRGIKALHIKSTNSAALPIWLVDQIYDKEDVVTEEQIREKKEAEEAKKAERLEKKQKRKAIRQEIEAERKGKKVKTDEGRAVEAPVEKKAIEAAPVATEKKEKAKKVKETVPEPEPEIVAGDSSEEEEEASPEPEPVKEKAPKKKEGKAKAEKPVEKPAKKVSSDTKKTKKREAEPVVKEEGKAKKSKKRKST